jgi:hypothetical protein
MLQWPLIKNSCCVGASENEQTLREKSVWYIVCRWIAPMLNYENLREGYSEFA